MRIVYTSDLHGYESLYSAFFQLAATERADAWIIGGDLSPRPSAPASGLIEQRRFFHEFLIPFLADWQRRQPHCRGFLILGNDDWSGCNADLDEIESRHLAVNLAGRVTELGSGYQITGYSYVPVTPFPMKDWEKFDRPDGKCSPAARTQGWINDGDQFRQVDLRTYRPPDQTSIAADLGHLAWLSDPASTVYVMHTPPWGTHLDVLHDGSPVGSRAVRDFILDHQPHLTLHGHIHESPRMSGAFFEQLGRTVAVNPGQSVGPASAGSLRAVVFELEDPVATIRHTRIPPRAH